MFSRKIKIISLALAALMLLSSCGKKVEEDDYDPDDILAGLNGELIKPREEADDKFTLNCVWDEGLNPIKMTSGTNLMVTSLMYDMVYTLDENFNLSTEMITEAKSEDNSWWVFTVNEDIKFNDGSNLTAKDIVYSIRNAMQSKSYRDKLRVIMGISAVNDSMFAISTMYPDSMLPSMLTIPVIKYGSIGEDVPPGTGPYQLAESGDRLVIFEDNIHASEMPIDTIYLTEYSDAAEQIKAFDEGYVDLVTNDPTGMFNFGYGTTNEVRTYATTNLNFVGFNMDSRYFLNPYSRLAIANCIDRDGIVNDIMKGNATATTIPMLPGQRLYSEDIASGVKYDPERATTLFQNSGVGDYDNDGELEMLVTGIVVEINIKLLVNVNSTTKVAAAQRICDDLAKIGITATVEALAWDDYIEALKKGEFDMYLGEIRLTQDWNLAALFEGDARDEENLEFTMNYGNVKDKTYSELYYKYLDAPDEERKNAYQAVLKAITDDAPITCICFERCQALCHRGIITGLNPSQYNIFNDIENWTIQFNN